MQMWKLKTLRHFWFIPFHYWGIVDNYDEEKVIAANKNTSTNFVTQKLLFTKWMTKLLQRKQNILIEYMCY